ncbi:MAG: GNAT family N-acetyltransferase [Rhizobium sp.]|nr:GNAT family N-acetyltransferase [Rhizobium sp.]
MGEPPIYNESMNSSANRLVGSLASEAEGRPAADIRLDVGRNGRQLSLYPGRVGYDLQEELDFLTYRVMEANVFFAPRFLAPAMPRLDERQIRLAVIRDEDARRSRVRLMMPFSVEKPGFSVGPSILRVWSNPFGPLGTPLVDAEGAAETIDNMLEALARPEAKLPGVLVLPDLRLNGRFVHLVKAVAIGRDLPLTVTNTFDRPILDSQEDGDTYLKTTISKNHRREMRRQFRLLGEEGHVSCNVARQPEEIRRRMEEFLALEASGWKGRKRSAMVMDRFRAAFAREAITNLAEVDAVRIHTLDLDGRAIASMVVFIMAGEAYTWKTAYDERYARFSPGKLLISDLTDWHLEDPNIERTDSCATPDHPFIGRFWKEREEMGTLLIGLKPNADRDMRQAATQLHMYRNTRNLARILRDKILSRRFTD